MDLVNTRRVLLALLLLIGFSVSGTAQIDLPRKQSKEETEKVEQRKEAPRDARAPRRAGPRRSVHVPSSSGSPLTNTVPVNTDTTRPSALRVATPSGR